MFACYIFGENYNPMKIKKISAPIWYYDYLAFNDGSNMSAGSIAEIQAFMSLHKIAKLKSVDYSTMTAETVTYVCIVNN